MTTDFQNRKMKFVVCLLLAVFTAGHAVPTPTFPGMDLINGDFSEVDNSFSRIVNGVNGDIADLPYQASLSTSSTSSSNHFCGAVIIDSSWALTAAHCVDGRTTSNTYVYVGSTFRTGNSNMIRISEITMHPQYNKGSGAFPNDIAVLKLASSVDGINNVVPVNIAPSGSSYDNQNCVISGWGRLSGSGSLPNTLQRTNMTVMTSAQCSSNNGGWGSNFNSNVHVCVNDDNSGACNGDSGGPLVCGNTLVGVTSFGASGCSTSYPSVYTRIAQYSGNWLCTIIPDTNICS